MFGEVINLRTPTENITYMFGCSDDKIIYVNTMNNDKQNNKLTGNDASPLRPNETRVQTTAHAPRDAKQQLRIQ